MKELKEIKIPLLGLYQPENCVKALEIALALKKKGYAVTEQSIKKGLSAVVWRARFERLASDPFVIYDGSHNPEGIAEAVRSIRYYFGEKKICVLTGVMRDKDYSFMAQMLAPVTEQVFCVTPDNPRALPSDELKTVYDGLGVRSKAYGTVYDGVEGALEYAKKNGCPLVCLGSLYMYAEVSDAVEQVKTLKGYR